ncbi:MAG: cyclic nucleotide-binding domain-containing protein [Polyangiales bacterium]
MIPLQTLRGLAALRDFTDHELDLLGGVAIHRPLPNGEVLWRQGDPGRGCLILVRGAVEVLREGAEGTLRVASLEAGSLVGQLALVDRGPRGATVRVSTEGDALELTRDDFQRLLAAASPLALRFQKAVALTGIRQHRSVIRRLATLSVPSSDADRDAQRISLTAIQAGTTEWGISEAELDAVEVVQPTWSPTPPRRRP